MIGDAEPEDAWHPDDPTPILFDQLYRRVALLHRHRYRGRLDTLDDLADAVAVARRRRLDDRERLRADQLDADIAHLRLRPDAP